MSANNYPGSPKIRIFRPFDNPRYPARLANSPEAKTGELYFLGKGDVNPFATLLTIQKIDTREMMNEAMFWKSVVVIVVVVVVILELKYSMAELVFTMGCSCRRFLLVLLLLTLVHAQVRIIRAFFFFHIFQFF